MADEEATAKMWASLEASLAPLGEKMAKEMVEMADANGMAEADAEAMWEKMVEEMVEELLGAEEVALDGRLMELDDPTLLRITRHVDFRALVALERTSGRLSDLAKMAWYCASVRQLSFALEGPRCDRVLVFTASAHVNADGENDDELVLVRHEFRVQMSGPEGVGVQGVRERLNGLLERLLSQGARPTSVRVGDLSDDRGYVLKPTLTWLAKDPRLPALRDLVLDCSNKLGVSRRPCEHEEIFAKHLPNLLGLLCHDSWCWASLHKYDNLRYACLDVKATTVRDRDGALWVKKAKMQPEALKRLRCLVLRCEGLSGWVNSRLETVRRIEKWTDGHLKLRRSSKRQHIQSLRRTPLAFACEDFDPAELKPLHLSHIWQ